MAAYRTSARDFCAGRRGGLIAGVAAYVKYLRPHVKVIGVEPEDSDCLNAALKSTLTVVLKVGILPMA